VSETPINSPLPSGTTTPRLESDTRHIGLTPSNGSSSQLDKSRSFPKKPVAVEYDSDIDPDDLLPVYLECKTKLFHLQVLESRKNAPRANNRLNPPKSTVPTDPESAKIVRKLKKIEDDVLFDQYVANQQWEARRIQLERDAAAQRNAGESIHDNSDSRSQESITLVDSDDEVSREAAKIGAAMLEENDSDDDAALADLFASLPVNEVDPITGKTSTVINGNNGVKVIIRDFGKWTGVNPTRVLEEACRARFVIRLSYSRIILRSFFQRYFGQVAVQPNFRFNFLKPPLPSNCMVKSPGSSCIRPATRNRLYYITKISDIHDEVSLDPR
jgi:ATP-dependent RNA helicase DHX29